MSLVSPRRLAHALCPPTWRPALARLLDSDLNARLVHGAFWSLASAVISRSVTLLASIAIARMLGKDEFGQYGIIQSTVGMLATFAGFGLGLTASRHTAQLRQVDPERATRIIALCRVIAIATGTVLCITLWTFAPWIASHILNHPPLTPLLRLGSPILLLSPSLGVQAGVLSGFEAFRAIARINLFVPLLSVPLAVGGTYFFGLPGAVVALAATTLINWLANYWTLQNLTRSSQIRLSLLGWHAELALLWRFGLPALLADIMVGPVNWLCNTLLVHRPHGYSELGVYNAANQWFLALLFLPSILAQVGMPLLSHQLGKNDVGSARQLLRLVLAINLAIAMPIALALSVASPLLMAAYGRDFAGRHWVLVFTLATAAILAIQQPVGTLIAATGRMWLGFMANTAWATAFIFGSYFAVHFGAEGLAAARLLAYALHAIWSFALLFYVSRSIPTLSRPSIS